MKEELKAFHINIDDIEQSKDLLINIDEAINKMKQNYVAEKFEVVLNNNLLEVKDKYTNFRTILGCRISYDNLDKDISFIVREDKKPTYEELQQELQRKDNIINELKKWAKAVQLTVLRSDNKPVYKHQDVLDKIEELENEKE